MRGLTGSLQTYPRHPEKLTLGHTRAALRLAALEAAASTLRDELTPAAQGVVADLTEGADVETWVALLGIIEHYTERVLAPARST